MSKILENTKTVKFTTARQITADWLWINHSPNDAFDNEEDAIRAAQVDNTVLISKKQAETNPFFAIKITTNTKVEKV